MKIRSFCGIVAVKYVLIVYTCQCFVGDLRMTMRDWQKGTIPIVPKVFWPWHSLQLSFPHETPQS